jgi:hypothetical protein
MTKKKRKIKPKIFEANSRNTLEQTKSLKRKKGKKQRITQMPLNKLGEFAEESGFKKRVVYNKYPIRDGYSTTNYYLPEKSAPKLKMKQIISEVYEDRKFRKKVSRELEQSLEEPLDDEQKKLVLYFAGIWDMSLLGEFLRQFCNVAEPEKLTWINICSSLIVFAQRNEVTPQMINMYPKKKWTFAAQAKSFGRLLPESPKEEWSKPMMKTAIMKAIGLDSYKTLKTFSKSHPIRNAGSKKLWQIRLNGLNKTQIEKLTKV